MQDPGKPREGDISRSGRAMRLTAVLIGQTRKTSTHPLCRLLITANAKRHREWWPAIPSKPTPGKDN